jgi:hypothetical protein
MVHASSLACWFTCKIKCHLQNVRTFKQGRKWSFACTNFQALRFYKKAAKKGHAKALYNVALYHRHRNEQDQERQLMAEAASQGLREVPYDIFVCK